MVLDQFIQGQMVCLVLQQVWIIGLNMKTQRTEEEKERQMLPAKPPYTWYIDTSTHRRATRCQHANAGLVQHDPVYIELGIST